MVEPGQHIGRYRIDSKLGAGGMGEVWRAWDDTLQRAVALKVVAKTSGSLAARLLGEARAAAGLRHANIVSVFDVGEDDAYAFVSMDLVEGRPLRDFVGDVNVTAEQKVGWLMQIASALRAAHKAGLVHRDVKPDNVMISTDCEALVLDFGLAKAFSVDAQGPTADAAYLTGVGQISGTPAYMAPEQLAGGPAAPAWDQYAWGVLGFELLTGKHPRVSGLISASGWVTTEPLATVPDGIAHVVARAMAPVASERFESMDAVVVALGGPSSGTAVPTPHGSVTPKPQSMPPKAASADSIGATLQVPVHPNAPAPQRRSRGALWVLAGAAVLGLGATVYALTRVPHTQTPVPTNTVSVSASNATIASAAPSAVPSMTATTSQSASSVALGAPVVAAPPKPRKLVVTVEGRQTFQYDAAAVDRTVRPMRSLVQACIDQHPPAKVPAAMAIDLELWSIGDEAGKVRDARLSNEPAPLARCVHDALEPFAFGPPKDPQMPPGAVFVMVRVDAP